MPNYGTRQAGGQLTAIAPGQFFYLFNAESPSAAQASIAFARAPAWQGGMDAGTTFQILSAATGVKIQGSNLDVDADYETLFTSTLAADNYTDTVRWAYYRAVAAGGLITVLAQR